MTNSSEELLARARAGDPAALNELVHAQRNGVYRYGLNVCRTTEDAEDAVQETLWAATRAIRTFRGSAASIASWMFTIVRRECLRLIERQRRAPSLEGGAHDFESDAPDPEDRLAQRRRGVVLAAALADLAPLDREVILLRDLRELSAPEAAAELGISIDALKSRLHRARVRLRDRVRDRARHPGAAPEGAAELVATLEGAP